MYHIHVFAYAPPRDNMMGIHDFGENRIMIFLSRLGQAFTSETLELPTLHTRYWQYIMKDVEFSFV